MKREILVSRGDIGNSIGFSPDSARIAASAGLVPTLKAAALLDSWYRGPYKHNGSCATLEDWFDPARTNDTYVSTGWKGALGTKTRAVQGHEFGLDLTKDERNALIAFLMTL